MKKLKAEVWNTIQTMNKLWTEDNKPDELVNYFHKNMVAITPSDKYRIEGQAACVNAWKGFCQVATTHYFKTSDPKIELYGDNKFAIVTYYFDMEYVINGQTIKMSGRDMFSLVKENAQWWIVSDQFSVMP
jgi:hypothetical protein